jgi:hypothetical protein
MRLTKKKPHPEKPHLFIKAMLPLVSDNPLKIPQLNLSKPPEEQAKFPNARDCQNKRGKSFVKQHNLQKKSFFSKILIKNKNF